MTQQVYDHVHNKLDLRLVSLGKKILKNVSEQVEVYRMIFPWDEERVHPSGLLDASKIAVLPFANISPDPNDSYFADGITEELISTLSSVSGLNVISRTSVMGYKGTTKKVREIGHELEVGSVLERSFRKAGSRIRVTTQLIAVNNEQHLWTQSYDRNLDDVFGVQSDIAKRVADALRVRILAPEVDRIDKKPTDSTKAYALYLKGMYHWNRRGLQDLKKAAEYFEQAVKEDEKFALAYVGLAGSYEIISGNWRIDDKTNRERAKTAVANALALDDGLAEAHAIRGLALLHDFRLKDAEEEFRKAIGLKPSYAFAHHWYAHLLHSQLRWDEALKQIEKAVELDPFSLVINLTNADHFASMRDYDRAIELYKKTVELDPSFPGAHFLLATTYGMMKRPEDARREAEMALRLAQEPYPQTLATTKAKIAYYEDDKEEVRRLLPDLVAHYGEPVSEALLIAGLYFYLGEDDKGFEWLEKSYSAKEYPLLQIKTDNFFDRVRGDPRYLDFLRHAGLE